MRKTIQFDKSAKEFMLNAVDIYIDKDGYLVNKKGNRVKSNKGFEIHEADFAGVRKEKGKLRLFTTDLTSLMELTDFAD